MLTEIHGRRLVRRGGIVDAELVLSVEGVGHASCRHAWIAFLAVCAGVAKDHAGAVFILKLLRLPYDFVETFVAAVEMIGAVVGRKAESLAIQCERTFRNSIRVSSHNGAHVWSVVLDIGIG